MRLRRDLRGPAAGPVAELQLLFRREAGRCITVDVGGAGFDAALISIRKPL